ncbi:hypothetical protein [Streptomyces sp. CB03234]|uniref:hypothetical protein n=1 Tax=Streptomyces sp. (strain CB03234) TaxID=1703937 RepID=UPI000A4B77EF|nr:hypothetical protein [Streptomyces sp. CB03234]
MTTADGWMATVRSRIGLGRLIPLGDAADGAWIAERAADAVLRRAARQVPGVEPGRLRIALAGAASATVPAFPAPPGSVPPGALRVEAEFAAGYGVPLPDLTERVRTALFTAAEVHLGLAVSEVDLRVTALLDAPPDSPATPAPPSEDPAATPAATPDGPAKGPADDLSDDHSDDPADDPAAAAAAAVPGVARLTTVLGPSVHRAAGHLRIELATAPDHRALDVARAVRGAVDSTAPVTVLVTEVLQS